MKVFWSLVLVLALAGGVVAFWPSGSEGRSSAMATGESGGTSSGAPEQAEPEAKPARSASPGEASSASGGSGAPTSGAGSLSLDDALDVATGKKARTAGDEVAGADAPAAEVKSGAAEAGAAASPAALVSPESTASTPPDESAPENGPPPTIAEQPDGSKLVDGQFVLKGEGTKEKPYEATWEMLVSVQETYDPSAGKKQIPGRIAMLDGRYLKLSGYVAFPLAQSQPKELLSMLNQWDGCCIGVPPTPYDAVEVQLLDRVTGENRMATYGVVVGRLTVKPYVVGDWLVGLYLMTDAEFDATQSGGT